jgi:hypothetical protein
MVCVFVCDRKANAGETLTGLDSELVSMVILEQVPLVVRSLPDACLLSDALLTRDTKYMNEAEVR